MVLDYELALSSATMRSLHQVTAPVPVRKFLSRHRIDTLSHCTSCFRQLSAIVPNPVFWFCPTIHSPGRTIDKNCNTDLLISRPKLLPPHNPSGFIFLLQVRCQLLNCPEFPTSSFIFKFGTSQKNLLLVSSILIHFDRKSQFNVHEHIHLFHL